MHDDRCMTAGGVFFTKKNGLPIKYIQMTIVIMDILTVYKTNKWIMNFDSLNWNIQQMDSQQWTEVD